MKTGSDFLRTAILGAIIGHVFLVRVIKINQDPWLPLDDDRSKSHHANDQNKEDENKFSNRQSFSEDYVSNNVLKHPQLYKGNKNEQEIFISSSFVKKKNKRYPNRKVINILPKVVEKEDIVSLLQWLSGAEKTLGQALRPVTSAVFTVLHSLSLDTGTDRQASIPAVDSLVDTAQFAVDKLITRVQENPDPHLVLSTLLLSLVTGNLLGNSISDKVSKAEKEKKDKKDKEKEKDKDKKKKRKRKKKDKDKDKEKNEKEKEKDDTDKDKDDEDDQFPILDDDPSMDNCPIGYELVYVQDCYIYQLSKSRSFPFELPGFGPSCPKDGYYCKDLFSGGGGEGGALHDDGI